MEKRFKSNNEYFEWYNKNHSKYYIEKVKIYKKIIVVKYTKI